MDESFLITPSELVLKHAHPPGRRTLSFKNAGLPFPDWRARCRAKLKEVLNAGDATPGPVRELRSAEHEGVRVHALLMSMGGTLTLPAYLLHPESEPRPGRTVMAIHGHSVGNMAGPLGLKKGGYNAFALRLSQAGFRVLAPFARGFGILRDVARDHPDFTLEYEQSMHFSYVMDAFIHGLTVAGENTADLLRWENWLAAEHAVTALAAAGLSYGGDLALLYPALSERVERSFCSGASGNMALHFSRCHNGPAHCIPGILNWMERSDIAGLIAPRPLVIHYGERDRPGKVDGKLTNLAAANNESVPELMDEVKAIYAAAGAEDKVKLHITPAVGHVLDVDALLAFLK